jgi:uncharacterized SAM-binding protein YcdF (DUF218 family)
LLSLHGPVEAHKFTGQKEWMNYKLPEVQTDAVIVLGGFMDTDSLFGYGVGTAFDRLLTGIRLVKQNKASLLVLSGGKSDFMDESYPAESELMLQFIREFNLLPDSVILLEKKSQNTVENALYTRELQEQHQFSKNIYLVTSATHLSRATLLFTQQGFNVNGVPVDLPYNKYTEAPFLLRLIPDVVNMQYWGGQFREWMGHQWHNYIYKQ